MCVTAFRSGIIFVSIILLLSTDAFGTEWFQAKDAHFVVYYDNAGDSQRAGDVLRKAENYYSKIARQIGYSRYSNFWIWEDRVRIFVFSRKEDFLHKTGQPLWSRGYAFNHEDLRRSRFIVTYLQEGNFLDGLLPHEISHLVLWDFIGLQRKIPMWFDEGVAQLQEANKRRKAHDIMKRAVARDRQISFDSFQDLDIRSQEDEREVTIFYAQALSVVDFLLKKYGSRAFGELCRQLREGKSFEQALILAYPPSIHSLSDLEQKWLMYIQRN